MLRLVLSTHAKELKKLSSSGDSSGSNQSCPTADIIIGIMKNTNGSDKISVKSSVQLEADE